MGKINVGRVILGGLLAGLIVNIGETILNLVVLASEMEAITTARNVPPVGGSAIAGFVIMCFGLGIAMVFLYAAFRPRFGPGPKTAAIVGVVVWVVTYAWSNVGDALMQLIPTGVMATALIWGFFESVLASVAGAAVYKE